MRKKLSRLKWNFVSIFVITLLGISLFHFFTGPKEKKYKSIKIIKIEITCSIHSNVIYYYKDLCRNYQKSLTNNITSNLNEAYNLNGKIEVKFKENFSFYTIRKDHNENIVTNYDELKKIIDDRSKIYLKQLSAEVSIRFTNLILDQREKLKLVLEKDKILPGLHVINRKLEKKLFRNLKLMEEFENSYTKLKSDKLYSLKINENIEKKLIDHKFARLNYLNVFLISLIFGIFLNVLFVLTIEVKRLYKW